MINYLDKLKKKCDLNDSFINEIEELFNKLLSFGYITIKQEKRLKKILFLNIDTVITESDISLDFKSGYYDSVKKELYIKDMKNMESIFLRLIYVLTTKEISNGIYEVGYSTAAISSSSYKIIHNKYGINRAIVSNLVCRLLYTIPATLSIIPTYRTYENDFIGNKLTSDNDIYFLEGTLLNQICFSFNISEEELYLNLFSTSPSKFLSKCFKKVDQEIIEKLFNIFDEISKEYSNYNKLCYLNRLLDKNYIDIKKNILNNDISDLEKEQTRINRAIKSVLIKLNPEIESEDENYNINIDSSLSEQINNLEESLLDNINTLQDILTKQLIANRAQYSDIDYILKLKKLKNILIKPNESLNNEIFQVISRDLLKDIDNTDSNFTEKIKYSLINEILSSERYIKIYKDLNFVQIKTDLHKDSNKALVAINIENSFLQLVEITNLNFPMKDIENNTSLIKINNLKYLLDTPSVNSDIHEIETLYTKIKNKYSRFSSISIDNLYKFTNNNEDYILVIEKYGFCILKIIKTDNNIDFSILDLSDNLSIFNLGNSSRMLTVYKEKKRIFKGMHH